MNNHGQRGATLMEFLIGFVIAGILVALAVPSFRDWIVNTQVRTASDGIKDGLAFARAEAVRRNTPVRWRMPTDGEAGWVVEAFDRGASSWTQVQQRVSAEIAPSVVVTASQSTVTFLGTGTVTPTPTAAITYGISNPNGGDCQTAAGDGSVRCLRVTVSTGGQIRMCDPVLPTGSAAAC